MRRPQAVQRFVARIDRASKKKMSAGAACTEAKDRPGFHKSNVSGAGVSQTTNGIALLRVPLDRYYRRSSAALGNPDIGSMAVCRSIFWLL